MAGSRMYPSLGIDTLAVQVAGHAIFYNGFHPCLRRTQIPRGNVADLLTRCLTNVGSPKIG
jgi:hypothetical protein